MKLASYSEGGKARFGMVTEAGIIDLSERWPSLKDALANASVAEMQAAAQGGVARPVDGLTFEQTIPNPDKIICVGLNYKTHADEASVAALPEKPSLFVRFPSSQVAHQQPVVCPKNVAQFDFEGELAVVIGRRARHVSAADAMDYVGGYTCFAENSARDWQAHSRQITPGKNFWHSGAMGPWLVTADEIPDPRRLELTTRLNGEQMQHDSVSNLIFDIPYLISYISGFTALEPGDVIATGTPSGVGVVRKPPILMKPGDRLEIEISGIGVLSNPLVAEEG
ncbi:MAG: fumarylacetoacetate hydrolase family protein [Burkholderiaceae bacterium]